MERGAHRRRANDACVHHALQLEVMHVREAPGDLLRDIKPRQRLADDGVARRILERRFRIELELETALAHELCVRDALAATAYPTVRGGELAPRNTELCGCTVNERLARRSARLADLHAAVLDRQAAERRTLVRRKERVAG